MDGRLPGCDCGHGARCRVSDRPTIAPPGSELTPRELEVIEAYDTPPFWQDQWAQLRAIVLGLPSTAALRSWRCWTCTRCQETFGIGGMLQGPGGFHWEFEFDGTPRRFGGKVASAIGRTDDEAWSNLLRALG